MDVKLMYVFVLSNIKKQLCTKNCLSSLDVSIRDVRMGSFFNVYSYNALFEFLCHAQAQT